MAMPASLGPSQPPVPAKHAKRSSTNSNAAGPTLAHDTLSVPYPHTSVNLSQLSVLLSTIMTASDDSRRHLRGQECRDAMQEVREVAAEVTVQHAQLFNDALGTACRYAAKRQLSQCVPNFAYNVCISGLSVVGVPPYAIAVLRMHVTSPLACMLAVPRYGCKVSGLRVVIGTACCKCPSNAATESAFISTAFCAVTKKFSPLPTLWHRYSVLLAGQNLS